MLDASGGHAAADGRALRRVLIVDSHEPVRRSLSRLVELRSDWLLVGATGCAAEALRLANERLPHVAIVDPAFGEGDATVLTQRLTTPSLGVRVVGYSFDDDRRSVSRLLEAGGHGFVSKHEPLAALVEAIERALTNPLRIAFRDASPDGAGSRESQSSA